MYNIYLSTGKKRVLCVLPNNDLADVRQTFQSIISILRALFYLEFLEDKLHRLDVFFAFGYVLQCEGL